MTKRLKGNPEYGQWEQLIDVVLADYYQFGPAKAAEAFGLHPTTVNNWARSFGLPTYREMKKFPIFHLKPEEIRAMRLAK